MSSAVGWCRYASGLAAVPLLLVLLHLSTLPAHAHAVRQHARSIAIPAAAAITAENPHHRAVAAAAKAEQSHRTAATAAADSDSCSYGGVNLSSLMGVGWLADDNTTLLAVCGALPMSDPRASLCLQQDTTASVCDGSTGTSWVTLYGEWGQPFHWSYAVDSDDRAIGVQYALRGEISSHNQNGWYDCRSPAYGMFGYYNSIVRFVCAAEQANQFAVSWDPDAATCTQILTLQTPLACIPKPVRSCVWNGYDLTPLMSSVYWVWDSINSMDSQFTFYLSVCGSIKDAHNADSSVKQIRGQEQLLGRQAPSFGSLQKSNMCGGANDGPAAFCAWGMNSDGSPYTWPIADWALKSNGDLPFTFINPDNHTAGIQYALRGQWVSWGSEGGERVSLEVRFSCARTKSDPYVLHFNDSWFSFGVVRVIVFPTPLACPPGLLPAPATPLLWNGYDLTLLDGRSWSATDGAGLYNYSLRIGSPFNSTDAGAACRWISFSASLCQVQVSNPSAYYDLGDWSYDAPPVLRYIDSSNPGLGLEYSMWGGGQCVVNGKIETFSTVVQLQCAKKQGNTATIKRGSGSNDAWCTFTLQLDTPAACLSARVVPAVSSSSSSSTGRSSSSSSTGRSSIPISVLSSSSASPGSASFSSSGPADSKGHASSNHQPLSWLAAAATAAASIAAAPLIMRW